MTLQEKIDTALELIAAELVAAKDPIVCCSFGKDSLVLLDLVYTIRQTPVLFWPQYPKQFPKKYGFARAFIDAQHLEVWTTEPQDVTHIQDGDYFDIFHRYGGRTTGPLMMAMGCRPWQGTDKEFVCAAEALLQPPNATVEHPWDLTFIGHKASDPFPLAPRVEFLANVLNSGSTRLCLPLDTWTDDDIWAYIRLREMPYDQARYDEGREDVNPDRYPVCFACLDTRRRGESVFCPVLESKMDNRALPDDWHAQNKLRFLQSVGYAKFHVVAPVDPEVTKKFLEREEQWALWSLTKRIFDNEVWVLIEDLVDLSKAPNGFARLREEWIRLERRCGEAGIVGWIACVEKANVRMQRMMLTTGAQWYAEDDTYLWVKKLVDPRQTVFPTLREIATLALKPEATHA